MLLELNSDFPPEQKKQRKQKGMGEDTAEGVCVLPWSLEALLFHQSTWGGFLGVSQRESPGSLLPARPCPAPSNSRVSLPWWTGVKLHPSSSALALIRSSSGSYNLQVTLMELSQLLFPPGLPEKDLLSSGTLCHSRAPSLEP